MWISITCAEIAFQYDREMEKEKMKTVRMTEKSWFLLKSRAVREKRSLKDLMFILAEVDQQAIYDLGYKDGTSKKKSKNMPL